MVGMAAVLVCSLRPLHLWCKGASKPSRKQEVLFSGELFQSDRSTGFARYRACRNKFGESVWRDRFLATQCGDGCRQAGAEPVTAFNRRELD